MEEEEEVVDLVVVVEVGQEVEVVEAFLLGKNL